MQQPPIFMISSPVGMSVRDFGRILGSIHQTWGYTAYATSAACCNPFHPLLPLTSRSARIATFTSYLIQLKQQATAQRSTVPEVSLASRRCWVKGIIIPLPLQASGTSMANADFSTESLHRPAKVPPVAISLANLAPEGRFSQTQMQRHIHFTCKTMSKRRNKSTGLEV